VYFPDLTTSARRAEIDSNDFVAFDFFVGAILFGFVGGARARWVFGLVGQTKTQTQAARRPQRVLKAEGSGSVGVIRSYLHCNLTETVGLWEILEKL
jgi:hypothetical protein